MYMIKGSIACGSIIYFPVQVFSVRVMHSCGKSSFQKVVCRVDILRFGEVIACAILHLYSQGEQSVLGMQILALRFGDVP